MWGQKKATPFTLARLVQKVRAELIEAQVPQEQAVMELESCEIELAVTVEGSAEAELEWLPVTGKFAASGQRVSTIKLSFKPAEGSVKTYSAHEKHNKGDSDEVAKAPKPGAEVGED